MHCGTVCMIGWICWRVPILRHIALLWLEMFILCSWLDLPHFITWRHNLVCSLFQLTVADISLCSANLHAHTVVQITLLLQWKALWNQNALWFECSLKKLEVVEQLFLSTTIFYFCTGRDKEDGGEDKIRSDRNDTWSHPCFSKKECVCRTDTQTNEHELETDTLFTTFYIAHAHSPRHTYSV